MLIHQLVTVCCEITVGELDSSAGCIIMMVISKFSFGELAITINSTFCKNNNVLITTVRISLSCF